MKYAKDEIVKVKVDCLCNGLPATLWDEETQSVVSRLIPAGESEVLMLGQYVDSLKKKVEDKWEIFETAKLIAQNTIEEGKTEEKRKLIENDKNPYAQFRIIAKRDLRPIRKLEILENRGRVVTSQTVLEEQMVDKKSEREIQKMQLETMQQMMAELIALKKENESLKAEAKKK